MLSVRPLGSTGVTRFFATTGLTDSRPVSFPGYLFPRDVGRVAASTPPGLPGSSTNLSLRAVPNHPGRPGDVPLPFLHHRWQASPSLAGWPSFDLASRGRIGFNCFTARRFALRGFDSPDCSDARSRGYMLNGQFTWWIPFIPQDSPVSLAHQRREGAKKESGRFLCVVFTPGRLRARSITATFATNFLTQHTIANSRPPYTAPSRSRLGNEVREQAGIGRYCPMVKLTSISVITSTGSPFRSVGR
jgi:hypothetical protein